MITEHFKIAENLDIENEVSILCNHNSDEYARVWIKENEAKEIIKALQDVFGLEKEKQNDNKHT